MICYLDGSMVHDHTRPQAGQKMMCGIGVVVLNGDEMISHTKRLVARNGDHESIAFVEACKVAHGAGRGVADVSFYTDCDVIGYAGQHLSRGNYSSRRQAAEDRIRKACNTVGDPDFADVALRYAEYSHIVKVRGHRSDTPIYHRRADYIARCAAQGKDAKSFDEWLAEGFFFVTGSDDGTLSGWRQYAPFTATEICDTMAGIE